MDPTTGVAWESTERSFFDRLWSTVWDATIDPVATFRALGIPGSTTAAVRFSLVSVLIGYWPLLFCLPCLALAFGGIATAFLNDPSLPPAVRGMGAGTICMMGSALPVAILLFSLFVELAYGVVFYGLSMLAGGKGSFGESIRAMLYTSAIRCWLFLFLFTLPIPFIGFFVHMGGRVLMLFWSIFPVYGAARGVHQLDDDRALIVSLLTPLIVAILSVAGLLGGIFGTVLLLGGSLATLGSMLPH